MSYKKRPKYLQMKHYDKTVVLFVLNIGMATVICPASKTALTSNDSQSNNTVSNKLS